MERLKSAREVADMLGLSISRIRRVRQDHGLGILIGNTYGYTDKDVEFIASRIGKRGRPNKEGA